MLNKWLSLLKTPLHQNPMVTAYLTLVFATPFSSGSPLHIVFFLCWFFLFILYTVFHTRKFRFSLRDQLKQHHPVAYYLLVLFCLTSLLSYLRVILGDVSQEQKVFASIRYVIYLLVFFYVFSLARFCLVSELSHSRIFFGYMLGTLILIGILLAIYHFFDAPNAPAWSLKPPLGEHVRIMGMIASVAVAVCLCLFFFNNNNSLLMQFFLGVSTIICNAFLIWTGSRASMLLVLLAFVILAVLGRIYSRLDYSRIFVMLLCISLSFLVADKVSIFEWNGLNRATSVSMISEELPETFTDQQYTADLRDKLTSGRISMWRITIKAFKNAPWLGLGPYGYFFIPDRFNIYDHPHNIALQFLIEWGIVGAVLLFSLLLYFAWQGLKNLPTAFIEKDTDYIISASVIFVLTLNAFVDGTYFLGQPIFALATAYAVFPFFTKAQRAYVISHVINK